MSLRRSQPQRTRRWALLVAMFAAAPLGQLNAQDAAPAAAAADASAMVEEPTEEQILDAYAAALQDINARSAQHLGAAEAAPLNVEVENIIKLGCRGMSRPGANFDCRVERRIRRGDAEPATDVVELWLSWEGGRWVAR